MESLQKNQSSNPQKVPKTISFKYEYAYCYEVQSLKHRIQIMKERKHKRPKTSCNYPYLHTHQWDQLWREFQDLASLASLRMESFQLSTNQIFLGLHPPKHGKLHPCKFFHSMNICHLHIGQWMSQNFILKSKSCTDV